MNEMFLHLSHEDRSEALEVAAAELNCPPHLLEKDVWVVWSLAELFNSPLRTDLTFKGGTSLSKAYRVIDRFSEDIDLTYDIRQLLGDMVRDGEGLPTSRSQAGKWSNVVRERLPEWVANDVAPLIQGALENNGLSATIEIPANEPDKLLLNYDPLRRGTGYV